MKFPLKWPAEQDTQVSTFDDALCDHVRPGDWPFQPELVLDDHLGPTDVLMSCRHCGRAYLLEMLDWRDSLRVMRVANLAAHEAERLVRDLTRGSCDLNRAHAEVAHIRSRAPFTRHLLLVDTAEPRIAATATVPPHRRVPGATWRELPCDGAWVDYVRSQER